MAPLESAPDLLARATEIGEPRLLVHRVLYRQGRLTQLFRDGDPTPREDRRRALEVIVGNNRADLHRLEELLAGL